jgi:hypothetical protein
MSSDKRKDWRFQVSFVTIDLIMPYFPHGAGEIRHKLRMAWGGEKRRGLELPVWLDRELRRPRREIHSLGVVHGDFSDGN